MAEYESRVDEQALVSGFLSLMDGVNQPVCMIGGSN